MEQRRGKPLNEGLRKRLRAWLDESDGKSLRAEERLLRAAQRVERVITRRIVESPKLFNLEEAANGASRDALVHRRLALYRVESWRQIVQAMRDLDSAGRVMENESRAGSKRYEMDLVKLTCREVARQKWHLPIADEIESLFTEFTPGEVDVEVRAMLDLVVLRARWFTQIIQLVTGRPAQVVDKDVRNKAIQKIASLGVPHRTIENATQLSHGAVRRIVGEAPRKRAKTPRRDVSGFDLLKNYVNDLRAEDPAKLAEFRDEMRRLLEL